MNNCGIPELLIGLGHNITGVSFVIDVYSWHDGESHRLIYSSFGEQLFIHNSSVIKRFEQIGSDGGRHSYYEISADGQSVILLDSIRRFHGGGQFTKVVADKEQDITLGEYNEILQSYESGDIVLEWQQLTNDTPVEKKVAVDLIADISSVLKMHIDVIIDIFGEPINIQQGNFYDTYTFNNGVTMEVNYNFGVIVSALFDFRKEGSDKFHFNSLNKKSTKNDIIPALGQPNSSYTRDSGFSIIWENFRTTVYEYTFSGNEGNIYFYFNDQDILIGIEYFY